MSEVMHKTLTRGIHQPDAEEVPHGWLATKLANVAKVIGGGKLGLTKTDHYRPTGYPAYSAAGQDGFVDKWEFDCNAVVVPSIGSIGRAYRAEGKWATLANTQVVFPDQEKLSHRYLHWRTDGTEFFPVSGTAQPFIKPSDFPKCWLSLPPLAEQEQIANVLDTLDTTIRQTETIIAKLKQVKQGLLHDLLTRGIDANGELRPPHSEAPHLYKPSPLGWIPKEWECVRLADRVGVYGGKRLPAGHAYAEARTAYKYLRVTDFYQRGYRLEDLENLHERTFNALQRYEISPGELCISIAGSLGHVSVHEPSGHDEIRTILTENAARLSPISQMSVHYVAAYMNSMMVQDQIEAEKGTGGGVPKLALFRIEQLWLAWPTHHEQCEIARRVDALDSRLMSEVDRLAKAHALKSGLMDDLLTGRVRVTPLLEAAATP